MRSAAALFICVAFLLNFLTAATTGCGKKKKQPPAEPVALPADAAPIGPQPRFMHPLGKVALGFELTAAEQAALGPLLESARTLGINNDQLRNPANARLFLFMAGAHGDDEKLVVEGLRGMARGFAADVRQKPRLQPITDDYRAVVRFNLGVDVQRVAGRAVEASAPILAEATPDLEVVRGLAAMIGDSTAPAAQHAALSVVRRMGDPFAVPEMIAAHQVALGSDRNYVLSRAADNIGRYSADEHRPALLARAIEMTSHPDEGVRGRAAAAMSQLARTDEERTAAAARLLALLEDSSGFVRSNAASELGRAARFEAAGKLMSMLDDDSSNRYDIRDFTTLDDAAGWEHHDGSAWSRVDDAVLAALAQMTLRESELRFLRPPVKAKQVELGIELGRAAAREWYEKHRSAIEARAAATP